MSLPSVLARIADLDAAFSPPAARVRTPPASASAPPASVAAPAVAAPSRSAFSSVLAAAGRGGGRPGIVQAAASQLGVTEHPPGSNDSPAIARYRAAVAGNPGPGPWCAYFVSWAARQAGAPLGDHGEGFAGVDALWAWAQRSGRGVANGPGVTPRPGDIAVWNEHVGIVEAVLPGGRIRTIEGNSSDRVAERVHAAGEAVGYVHTS